ncbi:MAG: nucleoside recognition domain-containing protein [Candidatus Eisenbacteria bacterium]
MTLVRHALTQALRAYARLFTIVAPIYAAITLLKHTPVLPWIAQHMAPAMGAFGLPGDAALVLVLGATINIYAAIAACAGIALTPGQATTLALMLGFAHNLMVESALVLKLSRRGWLWIALRITAGLVAGLALGPVLAHAWPGAATIAGGVPTVAHGVLYDLFVGGGKSLLFLFLILFPIVFLLEVLQGLGALARLRRPLKPVLAFLGFDERASEALIAGLFFGLVYGAGVILTRVEEEGLGEDQVGRLCLGLVLCHAIVEDTLLFAPVGAVVWPVVLVRVLTAAGGLLVLRALPNPSEGGRT